MAFFPLYPLLIRFVGALAGNHFIAGLLISNACFFFGLLFLYKLLEHEYDRSVARRAIFYVSIFPTAVFFSAVYTESLFFMLTVASFYYMRERRWWLAGCDRLLRGADARRRDPVGRAVRHRMVSHRYRSAPRSGISQLGSSGADPARDSRSTWPTCGCCVPTRSTSRTSRSTGTGTWPLPWVSVGDAF